MSKILGIDPGCKTGLALFVDGKLVELSTTTPQHLAAAISTSVTGPVWLGRTAVPSERARIGD